MAAFDDYEERLVNPCQRCRGSGLIAVQECDGMPLTDGPDTTLVIKERAATCPECYGSGRRQHSSSPLTNGE